MNADDFRSLYRYHFAINRKIWTECIELLTDDQFTEQAGYSIGSARNQTVHMASVDDRWFSGLRNVEVPSFLNPQLFLKRGDVRQMWDEVEERMERYLMNLDNAELHKPASTAEDEPLKVWQVLVHVVNHGTDHRAQLLQLLSQLGVKTFPQDYVFFAWGKM